MFAYSLFWRLYNFHNTCSFVGFEFSWILVSFEFEYIQRLSTINVMAKNSFICTLCTMFWHLFLFMCAYLGCDFFSVASDVELMYLLYKKNTKQAANLKEKINKQKLLFFPEFFTVTFGESKNVSFNKLFSRDFFSVFFRKFIVNNSFRARYREKWFCRFA